MRQTRFLALVFLSLLIVSTVSAEYYVTHDKALGSTAGSVTSCVGEIIQYNSSAAMNITGVQRNLSSTIVNCYLYNGTTQSSVDATCTGTTTKIGQGTFNTSTGACMFNKSLTVVGLQNFTILMDGTHTMVYGESNDNPVNGNMTPIRFMVGAGATTSRDGYIRDLRGIYMVNATAEPLPPGANDTLGYSAVTISSVRPSAVVNFSITFSLTGTKNYTNGTFSHDNGSGVFTNQTFFITGNGSQSINFSKTSSSTLGATIRYQWTINAANSTNAQSNTTGILSFNTSTIANGVLNYTKYPNNPVTTYPSNWNKAGGENVEFIENGRIFSYVTRQTANNASLAIWLGNSTDPYNITYTTQITSLGWWPMAIAKDQYLNHTINGEYHAFGNGAAAGIGKLYHYKSSDKVNFVDACAGNITATNYVNIDVVYNGSIWFMAAEVAFGGTSFLTTSDPAGCANWTVVSNYNTPSISVPWLGLFNDTFVMYADYYNSSPNTITVYVYTMKPFGNVTFLNISPIRYDQPAWEDSIGPWGTSPLIIPDDYQSSFDKKFYLYYAGGSDATPQNLGIAYDADNRSFYDVHNVVASYRPNATASTYNGTYPLLNGSNAGLWSSTLTTDYSLLMNSLYANGNATTTIGNSLWVPWYTSSSACGIAQLQSGTNCNVGTVSMTNNCMVSDEFSQVGLLVSMDNNATRMHQFYNTLLATNSSRGTLQSWKMWRDGSTIKVCDPLTNSNCDTASDSDARNVIALYQAANNTAFTAANRTLYKALATQMVADMLKYEVVQSCVSSHLGYGDICYWPAGGSVAKYWGMTSSYFTYTGYLPDIQQAFAMGFSMTGNNTYAAVAGNISIGYLQASYPNGFNWSTSGVRAPPGTAFHWANTTADPAPVCDNNCNPDNWDSVDAARAIGYCQANYWMRRVGLNNTAQETYCNNLGNLHFNSTDSTPLQLYPNGTNSSVYVSGYFSQGLAALHQMGGHNQSLFNGTLMSALGHYSDTPKTWDYSACFGVYKTAFPIRALGEGIGLSLASWQEDVIGTGDVVMPSINITNISFYQGTIRSNDDAICRVNTTYVGIESNLTFTYSQTVNGIERTLGSINGSPNTFVNVSTLDHIYIQRGDNLTCTVTATDGTLTSIARNATVQVGNALPVVLTATLSQANNIITANYTASDNDNDTITAAYYQWFVNNVSNATTQTINITGFPNGVTAVCQITVTDTENSTALNSTSYFIGDFTAPNITGVTIVPPSVTIGTQSASINANITDERIIVSAYAEISGPSTIAQNWSMTLIGTDLYQFNYTPSVAGTYTVTLYATDGNGNVNRTTTSGFSATGAAISGGGGGGGGSSTPSGDICSFSITKPVNGYANLVCPPGRKISPFTVTIYNQQSTEQSYQTLFNNIDCKIDKPTFTVTGKSYYVATVSDCTCPSNSDDLNATLSFQNNGCVTDFPIRLYTNAFTRALNDSGTIVTAALIIVAMMLAVIFLVIIMRR